MSDPRIKAIGFTGSRAGGIALMKLAAARGEPIPVYAEMSSVNPVVLLPAALEARAEAIGSGFAASLTLGVGQFCTNPGLVLALDGPDLDRFVAAASQALAKVPPGQMLSANICASYRRGGLPIAGASRRFHVASGAAGEERLAGAALFEVSAKDFAAHAELNEEVFGPASVVVRCRDIAELMAVANRLEGQLTATLHLEAPDHADARKLLPILERKSRAASSSMLADGRGGLARDWCMAGRFRRRRIRARPPSARSPSSASCARSAIRTCRTTLLAPELRDENPLGIRRMVDGKYPLP